MKRGKVGKNSYRAEVCWDDSIALNGRWRDIPEALSVRKTATAIHSIGYVLADDKRGMVLAGSVHGHEATGMVVIPRGVIRKVTRLAYVEAK